MIDCSAICCWPSWGDGATRLNACLKIETSTTIETVANPVRLSISNKPIRLSQSRFDELVINVSGRDNLDISDFRVHGINRFCVVIAFKHFSRWH